MIWYFLVSFKDFAIVKSIAVYFSKNYRLITEKKFAVYEGRRSYSAVNMCKANCA